MCQRGEIAIEGLWSVLGYFNVNDAQYNAHEKPEDCPAFVYARFGEYHCIVDVKKVCKLMPKPFLFQPSSIRA